MNGKTLTVMIGGQRIFQLMDSGSLLMPTLGLERADVITALQSALEALSCDGHSAPGDAVERYVAHEADDVLPTVVLAPISPEQDRRAAKIAAPLGDGSITLRLVVDSAIPDNNHAKGDPLLADPSKLN